MDINADTIEELIPEYASIIAAGDGRAADMVHEESSAISKALLKRAMQPQGRRFNIVYDATLANASKTRQLFTDWKARGYHTHLVGVTIDPHEGITRAFLRAKRSGRWVPVSVLKSAHAGFNAAVKDHTKIADSANIYDNTQSEPTEIASKRPDDPQLSVVNQALWDKIDTRSK